MTVAAAPAIVFSIAPEQAADRLAVDALVLSAFGPGRYAKTAERLRERARLAAGFVATEDSRVVGSVRLWSVAVGETSALFLGPIAVAADSRRSGLGADLVAASVEEARRMGVGGVLLIGDPPYFERFGFTAAPDVRLPGPADPRRIMWLSITADAPAGIARPID